MPLNFPSAPSNGDYDSTGKWQFSSTPSPGVWKAVSGQKTVVQPSATPPANPVNGNLWYNTNDGTLYIYYTDQDTSQWVEVKANSGLGATLGARVDALEIKSPNYIINGGMDIWQRGTSITATNNNYTADQWIATPYGSGGSFTVAKGTTNAPSGFQNYMKVTPVSSTSVNLFIAKFFETQDVIQLAGKTVTLSFQYKIPVSFTSQWSSSVWYSTATDSKVWAPTSATQIGSYNVLTNSTSWTSSSVTFTVPSNATSLGIQFASTNNVVSTAEFNLTGVQLEVGSVATPFRRNANSLQGELAACQRYYWRNTPETNNGVHGNGYTLSTTFAMGFVPIPVTPRTKLVTVDWSGIAFQVGVSGGAVVSCNSITIDQVATNMLHVSLVTTGSWTANYQGRILNATTTTGYLGFSAEL